MRCLKVVSYLPTVMKYQSSLARNSATMGRTVWMPKPLQHNVSNRGLQTLVVASCSNKDTARRQPGSKPAGLGRGTHHDEWVAQQACSVRGRTVAGRSGHSKGKAVPPEAANSHQGSFSVLSSSFASSPFGLDPAQIKEILRVLQIAGPLFVQYIIGYTSHIIDTAYVGHLEDPLLLSSMVLAGSLSMATGYRIISGLASASETLAGQAAGANNTRALGDTLQRSIMICALACVPITAAWMNSEWILEQLGQPHGIAASASRYLQLTLPALYMHVVHECLDKYLLAQRVVQPGVVITAISTMLMPAYCWLFVNELNLGLEGAAYAYCMSQATTTGLTMLYTAFRERQLLGTPNHVPLKPSMAAFENWAPYLTLAVPATFMYCLEGWAVEVLVFLSGILENPEVSVGVTGLCLQISSLVWMAAASIGSATTTRIANKLGKGDARGARRAAHTSLGMVLASQLLLGSGAYVMREQMMGVMTNSPEVIYMASQVMPVLACCFVADGLNAVAGAVLRGAGRQWLGASLNLAGWWCLGVPLSALLSIPLHMNVPGLWAGFATASAVQAVAQLVVVSQLDWDREVERAQAMMGLEKGHEGADSEEESEDSGMGASGSLSSMGSRDDGDGTVLQN